MTRREDPVEPAVVAHVYARDRECVVGKLVRQGALPDQGPCRGQYGQPLGDLRSAWVGDPRHTLAHVRDRAGGRMSRRPPSIPRRLAVVCFGHHIADSIVDRREVRPVVDAYLVALEGPDVDQSRPWEVIRRVRARSVDSAASEPEGGADGPR